LGKIVLLIDDDPDVGRLVEIILNSIDLTVYQAYNGLDGLKKSYEIHPDLVILDVMMPGLSGFEVCERLREMSSVPILMLTAFSSEKEMLRGFSLGADDFVKKPFNKNEFEARVRSLLRRSTSRKKDTISYIHSYEDAIFKIDLTSQTVKIKGKIVELTPREYSLLAYLVREQGKIVSKRELAREVWGDHKPSDMSNTSLYIYYLRKKIQDGEHGHWYIQTQRGRGYWFEPREEK
jgi:DNA-binding response OmpR family regulator